MFEDPLYSVLWAVEAADNAVTGQRAVVAAMKAAIETEEAVLSAMEDRLIRLCQTADVMRTINVGVGC